MATKRANTEEGEDLAFAQVDALNCSLQRGTASGRASKTAGQPVRDLRPKGRGSQRRNADHRPDSTHRAPDQLRGHKP